jgi:hypothetical protein
LWPTVLLGDGQWDHVIRALERTGTKRDAAIAKRIAASVGETRRRYDELYHPNHPTT